MGLIEPAMLLTRVNCIEPLFGAQNTEGSQTCEETVLAFHARWPSWDSNLLGFPAIRGLRPVGMYDRLLDKDGSDISFRYRLKTNLVDGEWFM
jgi:hypothetical protein